MLAVRFILFLYISNSNYVYAKTEIILRCNMRERLPYRIKSPGKQVLFLKIHDQKHRQAGRNKKIKFRPRE